MKNNKLGIACVVIGALNLLPFISFFLFAPSMIFCGICEHKFRKSDDKTNLLLSRIGFVLIIIGIYIIFYAIDKGGF